MHNSVTSEMSWARQDKMIPTLSGARYIVFDARSDKVKNTIKEVTRILKRLDFNVTIHSIEFYSLITFKLNLFEPINLNAL